MAHTDEEKVLHRQNLNAHTLFVLCMLGFGSISYGYNASIIGTTLGQPSFIEYMGLATRPDGTDLESSTNGVFQTGGVIGTLILPYIADKWGRKWGCASACILLVISGALMTASVNIDMFIAFRFFAGAGSFMILAAVPILMNEVVPVKLRGALVDIHAVLLVLGYAISGWVGFGFYFWKSGGSNTWRPPMALTMVWQLILLIGLPFLPESPRWLCMQSRDSEAERILVKLHSDSSDPDNIAARAEIHQIKKQIELDRTLGNTWMHIIKKPSYRKRALLAIGTCGIVQCSGVLVINNYGPTLYKQLGFSEVKQLLYPAAWLTFGVGLNVMAMPLVDRFPRPQYMALGVLGCMATLIVEAALVANFVTSDHSSALLACVAMFFLFQVFYSLCLDGTQFSYLGEVFPMHLRAKAFIIPGTIGGIVMWLYFPDTKGVPLEEIAAIFGDADEVAVYERELAVGQVAHAVVEGHMEKGAQAEHIEASV